MLIVPLIVGHVKTRLRGYAKSTRQGVALYHYKSLGIYYIIHSHTHPLTPQIIIYYDEKKIARLYSSIIFKFAN